MPPLRTIAAALACGWATAALADQVVTLRVPVTLQNLHSKVAMFGIGCFITPTTAWGKAHIPVPNHSFDGVVDVKVTVSDAQSLSATGYQCKLFLFPAKGNGFPPEQGFDVSPEARATTDAPFRAIAEGLLPKVGSGPVAVAPSARAPQAGAAVPQAAAPAWGALGGASQAGAAPVAPNAAPKRSGLSSAFPPPGK